MEVSVKDIIDVYVLLNGAKLTKMGAKAQVKLVRIVRKLKGIVAPYEEYGKDAAEKLRGDNHDEYSKKLSELKEQGADCKLTKEERIQVLEYFNEYSDKLNESLKDEFEKLHEVDFDKLTEEEFEQLIASNEFSVNQIIAIEDLIK